MYQLKVNGQVVAESPEKFTQTRLKKYGDQPVWISGIREIAGWPHATQEWSGVAEDCPDLDFFPGEVSEPPSPVLSVIAFKMCFTSAERLEINTLKATDPVIADFFSILDDPRCTAVDCGLVNTQEGVIHLVGKVTGFTEARAMQVLAGKLI